MSEQGQNQNGEPAVEDPEAMAAEARRYRDALRLLVETIRKNHPDETPVLVDRIQRTGSVPEATQLLLQLSENKDARNTQGQGSSGSNTQK
ncbi:hypothetical protein BJX63DRAFT_384549 [Aspergillus granulosus]|uniref:Uncharacterized protein n=1 Tax=Aspergillus granulosus TaxID=176169 RepID=A0ABR4HRV1_9EURO